MTGTKLPQAAIAVFSAIIVGLLGWPSAVPAYAQVSLEVGSGEIVIHNEGSRPQRAFKSAQKAGKGRSQWMVEDEVGNSYEACSRTCYVKDDGTWSCSGYSSGDGVSPALVSGYADALQHLVDNHGAVIEHDAILNVDYVSFPDAEDPYQTLVNALLNDYLDGRLLVEYFKTLEIGTKGPEYTAGTSAKPTGRKYTSPDDPFFGRQWNLTATRLFEAAHHPFESKLGRPVRIGIIDSGIDERFQQHVGLDGVAELVHRWTTPPTGFGVPHALGIATLLVDAANDGDGIAGLLGTWEGRPLSSDVVNPPTFQLYSFSAGEFGPVSYLVARAITAAIADGVDVINLSLRIAYSPMVENAIEAALEADIVVVSAAGNYHPSARYKPTGFPASMPGVIAVAATGESKRVNQYSADEGFDLVAPGERILMGGPNNSWVYGDGTSFAAPHVAAAAALLKAANPDLNSSEVLHVLRSTGSRQGNGGIMIDALAALKKVERQGGSGLNKAAVDGSTAGQFASGTKLKGNYPNPFNPATMVTFSLPAADQIRLEVYDVTGRRVRTLVDGELSAGQHEVRFDAMNLPSGVYYYSLLSTTSREQGVMTLLR